MRVTGMFQSLSRDSGRLNEIVAKEGGDGADVSIPQSGFGAFELHTGFLSHERRGMFQSLSRDSGRLNEGQPRLHCQRGGRFNPSVGIRGV